MIGGSIQFVQPNQNLKICYLYVKHERVPHLKWVHES